MSEQYSKTRKSLAKIDFFENHNILEEKDKSKSTGVINKPVLNNVCQGDKIERKPTVRAEYAGHYTKFGDAMGALFSAHYNEIKGCNFLQIVFKYFLFLFYGYNPPSKTFPRPLPVNTYAAF
eukprot:Pgem_evm1s3842